MLWVDEHRTGRRHARLVGKAAWGGGSGHAAAFGWCCRYVGHNWTKGAGPVVRTGFVGTGSGGWVGWDERGRVL
jgi:hypothetical protein